jgi:hypothetical protein
VKQINWWRGILRGFVVLSALWVLYGGILTWNEYSSTAGRWKTFKFQLKTGGGPTLTVEADHLPTDDELDAWLEVNDVASSEMDKAQRLKARFPQYRDLSDAALVARVRDRFGGTICRVEDECRRVSLRKVLVGGIRRILGIPIRRVRRVAPRPVGAPRLQAARLRIAQSGLVSSDLSVDYFSLVSVGAGGLERWGAGMFSRA